jgi:hypothetical protein
MKEVTSKRWLVMPMTILVWYLGIGIYGYLWVNNVLATETLYGYERSRLLISSAFLVYRVPYLLIALVIVLGLELFLIPGSIRKLPS